MLGSYIKNQLATLTIALVLIITPTFTLAQDYQGGPGDKDGGMDGGGGGGWDDSKDDSQKSTDSGKSAQSGGNEGATRSGSAGDGTRGSSESGKTDQGGSAGVRDDNDNRTNTNSTNGNNDREDLNSAKEQQINAENKAQAEIDTIKSGFEAEKKSLFSRAVSGVTGTLSAVVNTLKENFWDPAAQAVTNTYNNFTGKTLNQESFTDFNDLVQEASFDPSTDTANKTTNNPRSGTTMIETELDPETNQPIEVVVETRTINPINQADVDFIVTARNPVTGEIYGQSTDGSPIELTEEQRASAVLETQVMTTEVVEKGLLDVGTYEAAGKKEGTFVANSIPQNGTAVSGTFEDEYGNRVTVAVDIKVDGKVIGETAADKIARGTEVVKTEEVVSISREMVSNSAPTDTVAGDDLSFSQPVTPEDRKYAYEIPDAYTRQAEKIGLDRDTTIERWDELSATDQKRIEEEGLSGDDVVQIGRVEPRQELSFGDLVDNSTVPADDAEFFDTTLSGALGSGKLTFGPEIAQLASERNQSVAESIKSAKEQLAELQAREARGDCPANSQCGAVKAAIEAALPAAETRAVMASFGNDPLSVYEEWAIANFAAQVKVEAELATNGELSGEIGSYVPNESNRNFPGVSATEEEIYNLTVAKFAECGGGGGASGCRDGVAVAVIGSTYNELFNIDDRILAASNLQGTMELRLDPFRKDLTNNRRLEQTLAEIDSGKISPEEFAVELERTRKHVNGELSVEEFTGQNGQSGVVDCNEGSCVAKLDYGAPSIKNPNVMNQVIAARLMDTVAPGLGVVLQAAKGFHVQSNIYGPGLVFEAKPGISLDFNSALSTTQLSMGVGGPFDEISVEEAREMIYEEQAQANALGNQIESGLASKSYEELTELANEADRIRESATNKVDIIEASEREIEAAKSALELAERDILFGASEPPSLRQASVMDAAYDALIEAEKNAESAIVNAAKGKLVNALDNQANVIVESYVAETYANMVPTVKPNQISNIPTNLPKFTPDSRRGQPDRLAPERMIITPEGSQYTLSEILQISAARYNESNPNGIQIAEIRAISETRPNSIGSKRHHSLEEGGLSAATDFQIIDVNGKILDTVVNQAVFDGMAIEFKGLTNGNAEYGGGYMGNTAAHFDTFQPELSVDQAKNPNGGRAYSVGAKVQEFSGLTKEIRNNTKVRVDNQGNLVIESYAKPEFALTAGQYVPSVEELQNQAKNQLSSAQKAAVAAMSLPENSTVKKTAEENTLKAMEYEFKARDKIVDTSELIERTEGILSESTRENLTEVKTSEANLKEIETLTAQANALAIANEKLLAENTTKLGANVAYTATPKKGPVGRLLDSVTNFFNPDGSITGRRELNDRFGDGSEKQSRNYIPRKEGPAEVAAEPIDIPKRLEAIDSIIGGKTKQVTDPITGQPTTITPKENKAVEINDVSDSVKKAMTVKPVVVAVNDKQIITTRPDLNLAITENNLDRFTDPDTIGYVSSQPSTYFDDTGELQYSDGIFTQATTDQVDRNHTYVYELSEGTRVIAPLTNDDKASGPESYLELASALVETGGKDIVSEEVPEVEESLVEKFLAGPKAETFTIFEVTNVEYVKKAGQDDRPHTGTLQYTITVDDRLNTNAALLGLIGNKEVKVALPEVTTLENATRIFGEAGFDGNIYVLLNMAEYVGEKRSFTDRLWDGLKSIGEWFDFSREYSTNSIISLTVYPNAVVSCPDIDGIENGYAYEVFVESLEERGQVDVIRDTRCGSFDMAEIVEDIAGHLERKYGFVEVDAPTVLERTTENTAWIPFDPTVDRAQIIQPLADRDNDR